MVAAIPVLIDLYVDVDVCLPLSLWDAHALILYLLAIDILTIVIAIECKLVYGKMSTFDDWFAFKNSAHIQLSPQIYR